MQPLLRQFMLGELLGADETRHLEFKEVKGSNPVGAIKNKADEYAVAFLNADGGRIRWGVENASRGVVGVRLSSQERDELRRQVMVKLTAIAPFVPPSKYRLELRAIANPHDVPDLCVVELAALMTAHPDRRQSWEIYLEAF